MRRTYCKTLTSITSLLAAACLATSARAAISVGPTGAGPLPFDTAPIGTDFLSGSFSGSGASITTTGQIDQAIGGLPASAFTPAFFLDVTNDVPPSPYPEFRYNSTGQYLQSRTTGVAGTALLATLQNDTGANQSELIVSYDLGVFSQAAGELPGHRVYFSVTGEVGTWQVIPEFSGIDTAGRLNATLVLASWPIGSPMYLLWFDDNANGITDPSYTIDNLTLSFPAASPARILDASSLTNRTVVECESVALSVRAAGSPAPTYEWFHDNNSIDGATSATFSIASMTMADAGAYYVRVCNASGCTNSPTNHLAFVANTNALTMLFAIGDTNLTNITVLFSRPIDTNETFLQNFIFNAIARSVGGPGADVYLLRAQALSSTQLLLDTDPRDPATKYIFHVDLGVDAVCPPGLSLAPNSEIPVITVEVATIALDGVWRLDDTGIDRGTAWRESNYDDGGWRTGAGPFDGKRGAVAADDPIPPACRGQIASANLTIHTCLNLSNATASAQIPTVYFRKKFNYTPHTAQLFRLYVDDGAAIYLNGVEFQRIGLPAGPLTYNTVANRGPGDAALEQLGYVYLGDYLHAGENVIAVEVHQSGLTSSDITFGLELISLVAEPPVALTIELIAGEVRVSWNPAVGTLQATDELMANPMATVWSNVSTTSPYTAPADQARRFYRVQVEQ